MPLCRMLVFVHDADDDGDDDDDDDDGCGARRE